MSSSNKNRVWVIAAVVGLAGAAGVWGLAATGGDATAEPDVPRDLTVDALKEQAKNPVQMFENMRGLRDREDLTDEQRQQVRRNVWQVMRATLDERMEQYYAAAPEDQNAVLDAQIDQFQSMRDSWAQRRKEREARREGGERPEGSWRRETTQQERKERSEGRNPDQMARRMAYFSAIRARAMQRGIDMPRGRGGPGGRRGGGRRGP